MTTTLTKKVGIAALIMMASVFLSRVMGLAREMVIASFGGATAHVDAYQVGFVLPEVLNHIVATGFLSVTFIPIFAQYQAQNDEAQGWRIFSNVLTSFGALLCTLIAVAMWLSPFLVGLVAPGLDDPSQLASAIRMTRIVLPAQLFFFVGGLLMAVQFAKERFFLPALAPLVYNLGIILGGLLLGPSLGMEGFSWGALGGAFFGNFLIQYAGAKNVGLQFRATFDFRHPALKKYILITMPLMLGLSMYFSTEFFLKFFGSYLPEGGIATLNYGLRVTLILVGLFGQAVGVASFPFLARLIAEGKMQEMNALLNDTLRRYISLVIPCSALMMVLSHEIVLLLFQRGRFDAVATDRTAEVLVCLLIGAFAFAAQTVVVRGYYAIQNTIFPALFGTLAVLVSIPIYWFGMNQLGLKGVALAISASALLQSTLLYALWNRGSHNVGSRRVYRFLLKIISLSAALGILFHWIRGILLQSMDASTFFGSLLICLILGSAFLASFTLTGYLLRISEIVTITRRVAKKVTRALT
jgi:putative peptidoglycan lipid II flippase